MRTPYLLSLVLSLSTSFAAADDSRSFQQAREVLERHCLECHGGSDPDGGLSLVDAVSAFKGGESGPAITPGKVDESLLVEMIHGDSPAMPKKRPPLKPEQVAVLKQWIAAGADWPKDVKLSDQRFAGQRWWSLEPLTMPDIPNSPSIDTHGEWIRNPIDAFIVDSHIKRDLHHSPEADARTLIRRLYFDLIGLPPTPEEVTRFVSEFAPSPSPPLSPSASKEGESGRGGEREKAYTRLIDSLLASPRYGERWARHWLDVVHFGETHGYDKDQPRMNAWPYRDYVIRAFNEDRPYGRFVEEQIAGDVLYPNTRDGIEALGFISAGPWDLIGHLEVPESKTDGKVARHLDRDDMVTNTMQTFNSLTVQCAQCHNHKFDPIAQADYYALQACFAAVDRTNRRYDFDPAVAARRAELQSQRDVLTAAHTAIDAEILRLGGNELRVLDERIANAKKVPRGAAPTQGAAFGYHSQIARQPNVVKWVQIDLGREVALERLMIRPCFDEFAGIGAGFGFPVRYKVESAADAEFTRQVTMLHDATVADQSKRDLKPIEINTKSTAHRFIRVTATKLALRQNDYILAISEIEALDTRGVNVARGVKVQALDSIEAGARWRRENLTDGEYPRGGTESSEVDELAQDEQRRKTIIDRIVTSEQRSELARLATATQAIDRALASLPPQRVTYVGTVHTGTGNFRGTGGEGGKPRPVHVLARGNILKPGALAEPGALPAIFNLPGHFEFSAAHREGDRRAALARWITDARHPLTWRSIVNRVWQYHFGRGLVDTPNDFGRNGQLPTHPELLDWLASDFRDRGQSLKRLHRLIVTSATYRQASADNATFAARDADNRYLWRMNRRRLDAEGVRDSVLVVAGKLQDEMYGPSFQDFVIEKPQHSPHYQYHLFDPNDSRAYRRSIYRFVVRSQQQPFMTTLDCADPSMQVDKRNESLSSLQALALLNNPLMVTMAGHFAARVERDTSEVGRQVDRAFSRALARSPTVAERERLTRYVEQYGLANLCRALLNLNEFVFVD